MWIQKQLTLPSFPRGFHLITDIIIKEMPAVKDTSMGLMHIFIKHTSASLTINEDADPTVRSDFESHFNVLAPEKASYYRHRFEGSDDMPAHLKSSILGSSITVPVTHGQLTLGTWQGIYLCEHRNRGGSRTLVLTLSGKDYS